MVDTMEINDGERRYMHHYNALAILLVKCSVLVVLVARNWSRHLAERAYSCTALSVGEDFPYAIRSVTEIMSQKRFNTMAATLFQAVLALMDAGVPLSAMVSGIAMGLIMDGDTANILSDIADAGTLLVTWTLKSAGAAKTSLHFKWT